MSIQQSRAGVASARRALVGPWADTLLLGGGSVLALLLLRWLDLSAAGVTALAFVMLVLANFVNHPHFAHSYQLFYGSWAELRNAGGLSRDLLLRWWWAGFVAPLLLAAALLVGAWMWLAGQALPLGVLLSLMGLLVGWHYVKQGFGMAMTDAALKRCYWPAEVRRVLLINAYACWSVAWVLANGSSLGRSFWGVLGVDFRLPNALVAAICVFGAGSSVWCGLVIWRCLSQWRQRGLQWAELPLAGLVAYVITLYLWTVFAGIDPSYALVIPFFHSLQYLTVVWRYKANEASALKFGRGALWRFACQGLLLGVLGFWLLPGALDVMRTGQVPNWNGGPALAIACTWIFINIHHYLIDNVLWRQGNPKVARFLFGS